MGEFVKEKIKRINNYKKNKIFQKKAKDYFIETVKNKYSYNFEWMGFPIIQYPQDLISLQEIVFNTRPNKIIETGIARGGSIIFFASLLFLLAQSSRKKIDYKVLSLDIDIRKNTKNKLKNHFLKKYFKTFEDSSISDNAINFVNKNVNKDDNIMVVLDSNHEEEHVLNELKIYAPLVSKNCYCIVMDTVIDFLPNHLNANRKWKKNNSPYSAIKKYLNFLRKENLKLKNSKIKFQIDEHYQKKSQITNMPYGVLKKL